MPTNKKSVTFYLYTDGGSRGNPGPAGVGAILLDENKQKKTEISKFIGTATNNVAEYLAVIYAVQEAVFMGASNVVLYVDSQLVARQLTGKYKVKDQNIRKFFDIAINLFRGLDSIEVNEIPREENKDADILANRAMDAHSLI